MMTFSLAGILAASLFGMGSFYLVGYSGLEANPWIDAVFWALLGAGPVVDFLKPCLACVPECPRGCANVLAGR